MSRPLRIEFPGAYYHVMNRGLTGQAVFISQSDFEDFMFLLEDATERWQIRVLSYCLMTTHYHLALQTPLGNLQRVMRHIDGVYTQRFNRRHSRGGPLFRGRYKAILIDADVYLAAVVRYIHLNPVEALDTDDPRGYRWSSHGYYLRPNKAPWWLAVGQVLAGYRSPADFHEFVLSGNEAALLRFYSGKRRFPVLGEENFISQIRPGKFCLSEEHTAHDAKVLRPTIESVIGAVAQIYRVSREDLFQGRRGYRNEPRQVAMYLVRQLCGRSLKEIAEVFSLGSYGGVGAACSKIHRRLRTDRELRLRIEKVKNRIV
ncbi:MAG: helix-turn-helix domain-containing protein [bacterium]